MYIDILEIEEMLSEYYDFSKVSEEQWKKIDELVRDECEKRGVDSIDDYETYACICDGCVEKVLG